MAQTASLLLFWMCVLRYSPLVGGVDASEPVNTSPAAQTFFPLSSLFTSRRTGQLRYSSHPQDGLDTSPTGVDGRHHSTDGEKESEISLSESFIELSAVAVPPRGELAAKQREDPRETVPSAWLQVTQEPGDGTPEGQLPQKEAEEIVESGEGDFPAQADGAPGGEGEYEDAAEEFFTAQESRLTADELPTGESLGQEPPVDTAGDAEASSADQGRRNRGLPSRVAQLLQLSFSDKSVALRETQLSATDLYLTNGSPAEHLACVEVKGRRQRKREHRKYCSTFRRQPRTRELCSLYSLYIDDQLRELNNCKGLFFFTCLEKLKLPLLQPMMTQFAVSEATSQGCKRVEWSLFADAAVFSRSDYRPVWAVLFGDTLTRSGAGHLFSIDRTP